jgi:hypothetical protein
VRGRNVGIGSAIGVLSTGQREKEQAMFRKASRAWLRWREHQREYALERALFKAGGGRKPSQGGATGGDAHLLQGEAGSTVIKATEVKE